MQSDPRYDDVVAEVQSFLTSASRRPAPPASRSSASSSTPASASARRWSIISSCCAICAIRCARGAAAGRLVAQVRCSARSPADRVGTAPGGERCRGLLRRKDGAQYVRVHDVAPQRATPCLVLAQRCKEKTNEQKIFRNGWHSRHGGRGADHAGFRGAAGLCRGQGAGARRAVVPGHAPGGADRQGHAHLRLYARGIAGGGICRGGRRRDAVRSDADAGRGLSDARAAAAGRAS